MNRVALGTSLTVLGIVAIIFPIFIPLPGAGSGVAKVIGALLAIIGFIIVIRARRAAQAEELDE